MDPPWITYEEAAGKVLADIRKALGISTVEGKQRVVGSAGTSWELDAKAWREDGSGFLVIEFRRHTTRGLNQEDLAAFAYRIQDVGGSGGIIVSPLPLQRGAQLVAKSAEVTHVRLSPESTTEDYLAELLGRKFMGATVTESVGITDTNDAEVIRARPDET